MSESYWITPKGEVVEAPEGHQSFVQKNWQQYDLPEGISLIDLVNQGWVRVSGSQMLVEHIDNPEVFLELQYLLSSLDYDYFTFWLSGRPYQIPKAEINQHSVEDIYRGILSYKYTIADAYDTGIFEYQPSWNETNSDGSNAVRDKGVEFMPQDFTKEVWWERNLLDYLKKQFPGKKDVIPPEDDQGYPTQAWQIVKRLQKKAEGPERKTYSFEKEELGKDLPDNRRISIWAKYIADYNTDHIIEIESASINIYEKGNRFDTEKMLWKTPEGWVDEWVEIEKVREKFVELYEKYSKELSGKTEQKMERWRKRSDLRRKAQWDEEYRWSVEGGTNGHYFIGDKNYAIEKAIEISLQHVFFVIILEQWRPEKRLIAKVKNGEIIEDLAKDTQTEQRQERWRKRSSLRKKAGTTVYQKGGSQVYLNDRGYFSALGSGWWGPDDFTIVGVYALISPDEDYDTFKKEIEGKIGYEYKELPTETDIYWIYLGNANYFTLTGEQGQTTPWDEDGYDYNPDDVKKAIDECLKELSKDKSEKQLAEDSRRTWIDEFIDYINDHVEFKLPTEEGEKEEQIEQRQERWRKRSSLRKKAEIMFGDIVVLAKTGIFPIWVIDERGKFRETGLVEKFVEGTEGLVYNVDFQGGVLLSPTGQGGFIVVPKQYLRDYEVSEQVKQKQERWRKRSSLNKVSVKVKVVWDTETESGDEGPIPNLPTEVEIPDNVILEYQAEDRNDDVITEFLSDEYGWCVVNWDWTPDSDPQTQQRQERWRKRSIKERWLEKRGWGAPTVKQEDINWVLDGRKEYRSRGNLNYTLYDNTFRVRFYGTDVVVADNSTKKILKVSRGSWHNYVTASVIDQTLKILYEDWGFARIDLRPTYQYDVENPEVNVWTDLERAGDYDTPADVLEDLSDSGIDEVKMAVAGNGNTSPKTLRELAHEDNKYIVYRVINNSHTPKDVLYRLSGSEDPSIRSRVAVGWHTPIEIKKELARDPDEKVRAYIASHTDDDEIKKILSKDKSELVRYNLSGARRRYTSEETLSEFVKSPSEKVRERVAKHPRTSVETLKMLATDESYRVRRQVALNRNIDLETLIMLTHDEDDRIRYALAARDYNPDAINNLLAKDKNWEVRRTVAMLDYGGGEALGILAGDDVDVIRYEVAQNKRTPPEALDKLSKDTDDKIRAVVATNYNTPPQALLNLAKDSKVQIRKMVVHNSNVTPEMLNVLSKDEDVEVRMRVADHKQTETRTLLNMATDPSDAVRLLVVNHSNANESIWRMMRRDRDPEIARIARERLAEFLPPAPTPTEERMERWRKRSMLRSCL